MKLIVLDGYALNPGDLSWDTLKNFGELDVYDKTPPELTIERSKGAMAVFTNKTVFDAKTLSRLPELKYIGATSTGTNIIDVEYARKNNITVTNAPEYSTFAVAQMTFALLLELCNKTYEHNIAVKSGQWSGCEYFCFWNSPLIELCGKNFGIIGYGKIGKTVAGLASALGMKVLVNTRSPGISDNNTEFVGLHELLLRSDVVSLHCPLNESTHELINYKTLEIMKPSAFLINTARGQIVNEQDLTKALESGKIAGCGLDVMSLEPPAPDNPLFKLKNCIITPHISWAAFGTRKRLIEIVISNFESYMAGNPVNVV
ncbi:MAG: D-2-hydroxyacid dehydrogenase [Clostridiales bacterium]|jgi:glycerate dehydrogenase|nr:D-2-hydroxyacid dehydrogenase [Clostridiales bacterium]